MSGIQVSTKLKDFDMEASFSVLVEALTAGLQNFLQTTDKKGIVYLYIMSFNLELIGLETLKKDLYVPKNLIISFLHVSIQYLLASVLTCPDNARGIFVFDLG